MVNPWKSLQREITGAVRSLRYDLARRRMRGDTVQLPIVNPAARSHRRRKAAVLALVALSGVSGYYAVMTGLGTLFATGTPPAGLPRVAPSPHANSAAAVPPSPDAGSGTGRAIPGAPVVHPSAPAPGAPPASGIPRPTGSPPVPTPAPTCSCGSPTPTPSSSPSTEPTPTPAPTPPPSPSPTSTMSAEPAADATPSTPFGPV